MTRRLPDHRGHDRCTSERCDKWSSLFPTKEDGSANVNGRHGERLFNRQLRHHGIEAALHPRGGWASPDGKGINPDLSLWVAVDGDDDDVTASYGALFALGEAKVQLRKGSAYQKIEHALRRYGHLSDEHGLVVVVFHMLCPALVGRKTLDELEVLADLHGVGWIGWDDISFDVVQRVTAKVTAQRRRRVAKARLDELVAELGLSGVGELARYAVTTEIDRRRAARATAGSQTLGVVDVDVLCDVEQLALLDA